MKIFRAAILTTLLSSNPVFATSLSEALISAYQNNPEMIAAREELKSTDEKMFEALSNFLPQVFYQYKVTQTKQDTAFNTNLKEVGYLEQPLSAKVTPWRKETTTNMGFNLNQNVFNGGQDAMGLKFAKYVIETGRSSLKITEQKILLDTIKAYLDVILKTKTLNINKEKVSFYDRKLETVKHEIEAGVRKRNDLAEAEAKRAYAYSELMEAEGEYNATLATYQQQVGIPPENIMLDTSLFNVDQGKEEILAFSLKNNPNITYAQFNLKAFELQKNINLAKMLPTIDLSAAIQQTKTITHYTGKDQSLPYTNNKILGLTMTIPIYQKGMEYSQVRQAKAKSASSRYSLKSTKDQITQKVTAALSQYNFSKESVLAAAQAVKSGESALDGMNQGYEEGINSITDLLTTKENLYNYQINHEQAKINLEQSKYVVAAMMGKLTAKDLGLSTKIYDPAVNYDRIKKQLVGF